MARVLRNNRREMTYGSQGPDPFFFNPSDLVGKDVAKRMLSWWTDITSVQQRLHAMFEPFRKAKTELAQQLNQGANTLAANCDPCRRIKNIILRLRALTKLITTLVKKFIKKYVTTKGDIFGLYVSPKQTCDTHHRDWWWFDTLHYRKTGDFTANLLDIGRGERPGARGQGQKDRLLSYAIGYLSHFAADVVGHAYVNAMVGGPYRHHAQRHTTMEKFMDVWSYNEYYDSPSSYGHSLKSLNNNLGNRFYEAPEVINSGMHKNQQFTAGRNPPKAHQQKPNQLFQASQQGNTASWTLKLPEEISLNFAEAVNGTYNTDQFGTFDPAEADISYRFWYLFFQMSTNTDSVRHPSDLPGNQPLNKKIQREWNRFKQWAKNQFNNVNFGGGGGGGSCNGVWSCLAAAAASAWNFIKNLGKAIASGVKVILALGQWLVNNLLSLPLEFLLWATQKLYEKAYATYKHLLLVVGATGFGYVYTDQVTNTPQIQNMIDPTAQDFFNNTVRDLIVKPGRDDTGFPRKRLRKGPNWDQKVQGVMQGLENEAHLVVPFSSVERPKTVPGPDSYGLNTPDEFIDNPGLNLDPEAIPRTPENRSDTTRLDFGPPSNPDDFRAKSEPKGRGMYTDPLLGDAVRLTVQLFDEYVGFDMQGRIPNLNMSGDRGIGFPTWSNTTGSYNADSPKDDDEDLDRKARRQNDPLQVEGCEWPSQQNWFRWTGSKNYKRYAWLKEPIQPVFEPDLSNERRY